MLTETSRSRIIDALPRLGWGRGRECTFLGSLESALSATEHPYSYDQLMGFTALAFRTRWFKPPQPPGWCPSCACGEMEEEIRAAGESTGWALRCRLLFKEDERAGAVHEIIESIDAGRGVLAYDANLNLGVVYGYVDDGRHVLFHMYDRAAASGDSAGARIEPAKLGWMWILIGAHRQAPPADEVFRQSLRRAVHNFTRGIGREGPGDFWYGRAAFERWSSDLTEVDHLSEEQQKKLFFVSWWNFCTMTDARQAAVGFLKRGIDLASTSARAHLVRAIQQYQDETKLLCDVMERREIFLGPWTGKKFEDWSDSVRSRERELLSTALAIEERAVASLQAAL